MEQLLLFISIEVRHSQYQLNFQRFEQGIKNMQTLLVNKFEYVSSTYIPRAGLYSKHRLMQG